VHREFVKVEGGENAVIVTRNDWVAPDGKRLCWDERTFTFGIDGPNRWIDMDIRIMLPTNRLLLGIRKRAVEASAWQEP
jgi:hypothetical protein